MMNKKRFLINGALLTAVGIAMRTVSLLFNAIITRAVGAEGVGLYTVVMTVYNFAVTFATAGISLTVTRLVAEAIGEKRENDVPRVLTGAVVYSLAFSSLATAVLLLGGGTFAEVVLGDPRAAASLRILAPSLIPLSLISVFSGYFVGIRKVAFNAVTQVFGQVFKICATLWLVIKAAPLAVEDASFMLAVGTTVTEVLCFILVFVEFLIERRRASRARGAAVGTVARTAVPLAVSAYIRQALLTVEHVLIPRCLQRRGDSVSEALSSYGILHGMALPMILYPMATLSSFSGLLVPEFAESSARGDLSAMKRICTRTIDATLSYATVTAVMLFVFSEELGYVIYGSHSAGYYIAVLATVVPLMYLDHVTDSILKGIGEQVYSMWVNITDSLLSIVLVLLLIPKMGIMGYAICIIVMEAYNFLLSFLRLRSRIRFGISFAKSILIPGASALAASVLTRSVFIASGAMSGAAELAMLLVFALAATVGIYNILRLLGFCIQKVRMRII